MGLPPCTTTSLVFFFCRSKTERRRSFIGDQLDECKDMSALFYLLPFQKGYLVNWDTQRQIWEYSFNDILKLSPSDTNLIFTEPPFNFPSIQDSLNEVFFEEFRFSSLLVSLPSSLSALYQLNKMAEYPCCVVVDSGYSFTHIIPYYRGKMVAKGIRRIDVGGKLLTNHLKEIVSYRQLHVLDETFVMNQVKEEVCFVSQALYKDMVTAQLKDSRNTIMREYVLPDFTNVKKGYVREMGVARNGSDEQSIRLLNERFTVPEILLHPSDIGIQQMGIPEAIVNSVEATPPKMKPHLYNNILLTGGNACFPGFKTRLYNEVRRLVPDIIDVNINLTDSPISTAWQGGKLRGEGLTMNGLLESVSIAEYKEHGHNICYKKFREDQEYRGKN